MMGDAFTPYEIGLEELQQELGQQHERLLEFLNYEGQLSANIRQARGDGETPVLSADRNRIVRQLNALALETVQISFNELCGLRRHGPVLTTTMVRLSPPVMLFFNLVVIAIPAFSLKPLTSASLPCVPPLFSASSLAVILLVLFHLAWRYFNPVFKVAGGTVTVTWIALPIKVLASLADALHPWILSDLVLWVSAICLFLAAVILGLTPLSPLPSPPEETVIIQSFSVEYPERAATTVSLEPGDMIEIEADELVLVKVRTLGQVGLCKWSAFNGSLHPAEGCSTLYSAPFDEVYDVLDVLAQSPCKTQNASASLRIEVTPGNQ